MDDKTRIKLLKIVLGCSVVAQGFELWQMKKMLDIIKHMGRHLDHRGEKLDDSIRYIHKIIDVCEPLPEQMREINTIFDFEKWEEGLAND